LEFASPQFWVAALEVVAVNILLSGDNAVVIALACRNLPPRLQRRGIFWGAVAVVVLRIALTYFAVQLLLLPWLRLVGAALLVWVGIRLITEEPGDGRAVHAGDRLAAAVKTVIVADLVMSFDNVIGVAGAARGSVPALVLGLVVSIPLVVVGSQLVMKLLARLPWLVLAGGGLLGYIAGEIAIEDPAVKTWIDAGATVLHPWVPVAGSVVVVAAGVWLARRRRRAATG
jgi:YjbE family integral membrane protein